MTTSQFVLRLLQLLQLPLAMTRRSWYAQPANVACVMCHMFIISRLLFDIFQPAGVSEWRLTIPSHHSGSVDWRDADGNILMRLTPKRSESCFVLNSRNGGEWASEERFDFLDEVCSIEVASLETNISQF